MTARHGGISILITSATDALAFLVGSATVLPALSWFCQFAGVGVILCFVLQITLFLPALALNARRARDNRYDCCCCFKAKVPHPLEEEQGCCCCCKCKSGILRRSLKKTGGFITTKHGTAMILCLFGSLLGVGIAGGTQVYKDFKLEWFFPDSSYVNEFFNWNKDFFQGESVSSFLLCFVPLRWVPCKATCQLIEYVYVGTFFFLLSQHKRWQTRHRLHAGFELLCGAKRPGQIAQLFKHVEIHRHQRSH